MTLNLNLTASHPVSTNPPYSLIIPCVDYNYYWIYARYCQEAIPTNPLL